MAKKVGIKVELEGNFSASMKKLGVTSKTSLTKITSGAKKAAGAFKALGSSIFSIKGLVAGVGVGLLVKKVVDLTLAQANLEDESIKTARAIGIEVEELTSLRRSAELGGASVGELDNGVKRLSRNIFDASQGVGDGAKAFDALGVSVVDSNGNLRSTQDVLLDVADAFKEMEDGTLKNAQSQLLFGKSGGKLINTLNQGSEAIIRQRKEAEKLGIIFSKEAAEDAEKLNDAITDLGNSFDGAFRQISLNLLPKITPQIKEITGYIVDNKESFAEFGDKLAESFKIALPVATALGSAIASTLGGLNDYLKWSVEFSGGLENNKAKLSEVIAIENDLRESRKKGSESKFVGLNTKEYIDQISNVKKQQDELKKEIIKFEDFLGIKDPAREAEKEAIANEAKLKNEEDLIKNKLDRQKEYLERKTEIENNAIALKLERDNELAEVERARKQEQDEKDLEDEREFQKKFFLETQDRLTKTAAMKSKFATDNEKSEEQELRDMVQMSKQIAIVGANAATDLFLTGKNNAKAKIGTSTAVATMRIYEDFPLPVALALTPLVVGAGVKAIRDVDKQKFEDGGIVQGNSLSGDRISVGVNSEEMILNKQQQSNLFAIANGNGGGGGTTNITVNAGAGTDIDALAQAVTNAVHRANQLRLEPQI